MVEEILKDEIDFYMFHQPNKFMLEKLAEVPNNIVEIYGNSNS